VGYVADLISAPVLTGFKIGIGISIAVGQLDSLLGVALIAFVESFAAARAFQRSEDRPVSADRELGALRLANVVSSLFRGTPAGGGMSQTAVNDGAGGRSCTPARRGGRGNQALQARFRVGRGATVSDRFRCN
jgi:MFS superfamily sulfate permease-like transporter